MNTNSVFSTVDTTVDTNINVTVNAKAFSDLVSVASCLTNKRDSMSNHLFNMVRVTFDKANNILVTESNNINASIKIETPASELDMTICEGGSVLLSERICNWLSCIDGNLSILAKDMENEYGVVSKVIVLNNGSNTMFIDEKSQEYNGKTFVELRDIPFDSEKVDVPSSFLDEIRFCAVNSFSGEPKTRGVSVVCNNGLMNTYSVGQMNHKLCFTESEVDSNANFKIMLEGSSVQRAIQALLSYTDKKEIPSLTLYCDGKGMWFDAKEKGVCVYAHGLDMKVFDMKPFMSRINWDEETQFNRIDFSSAINNISRGSGCKVMSVIPNGNNFTIKSVGTQNVVESNIPCVDVNISCDELKHMNLNVEMLTSVINSLPGKKDNSIILKTSGDNFGNAPIRIECGNSLAILTLVSR